MMNNILFCKFKNFKSFEPFDNVSNKNKSQHFLKDFFKNLTKGASSENKNVLLDFLS